MSKKNAPAIGVGQRRPGSMAMIIGGYSKNIGKIVKTGAHAGKSQIVVRSTGRATFQLEGQKALFTEMAISPDHLMSVDDNDVEVMIQLGKAEAAPTVEEAYAELGAEDIPLSGRMRRGVWYIWNSRVALMVEAKLLKIPAHQYVATINRGHVGASERNGGFYSYAGDLDWGFKGDRTDIIAFRLESSPSHGRGW